MQSPSKLVSPKKGEAATASAEVVMELLPLTRQKSQPSASTSSTWVEVKVPMLKTRVLSTKEKCLFIRSGRIRQGNKVTDFCELLEPTDKRLDMLILTECKFKLPIGKVSPLTCYTVQSVAADNSVASWLYNVLFHEEPMIEPVGDLMIISDHSDHLYKLCKKIIRLVPYAGMTPIQLSHLTIE
jgi:hypothetical protein